MRRWLSRVTGNYIGITRYLEAAQQARRERDEAMARAVAAVELARLAWQAAEVAHLQAEGARRVVRTLLEPGEVERCRKVRLRTRDEAETFAARVMADTGCGRLEAYRCPHCPRRPVSLEKFFHVRHADWRERNQPHRHQTLLLKHVPLEQIEALRAKFGRPA